jgi:peptide-methionine (S)-S-oxide reductase
MRKRLLSLAAVAAVIAASIVVLWRNAGTVRTALAESHGGSAYGTASGPNASVAVLAGGCYWGMEYVFDHVRGVTEVTSGYAIPVTANGARFEGAAEAVRIEYDTTVVSYNQLLEIFFSVAHDPTQLNRQGPDVGPSYRSIAFPDGDGQRALVHSYIDSLDAARAYPRPVVTQIATLQSFAAAEPSEQRYAEHHLHAPYIVINDVPKLKALKARFPAFYSESR